MSREPDGRIRILQAALAAFARDGDAATIRGIAASAGVSPALVQHHFTTKNNLRRACDAYVISYFQEHVAAALDESGIGDPGFLAEVEQTSPPVIAYLTRILMDATPQACVVFDALVELTKPKLPADGLASVPDRACVLVAMQLGTLMLRPHLDRHFGEDSLGPGGMRRRNAAVLDLLNPDITAPDVLERARKIVQPDMEAS